MLCSVKLVEGAFLVLGSGGVEGVGVVFLRMRCWQIGSHGITEVFKSVL